MPRNKVVRGAAKPDVLLSEEAAGEVLGVSKYTIRRLRRSGDLSYVMVRHQVRVPTSVLEDYIAANTYLTTEGG